jgi:pyruvate formate lyase activating enzyme
VAGCPSEALSLVGRSVAPGELADELARDRSFFDASGGGVTLSGGEPTAQPAFCAALVRELRAREVRVGLETCGLLRWAAVEGWLGLLDFVLFDLKIMDDARHRLHTGAGNERILANARQLVAEGLPVRFRMPIVPGFTDDDTNVARVGAFLAELGVKAISLLRYHSMGEAKIARVGAPLGPLGIDAGPSAQARLAYAKTRLTAFGLEVTT